MYIYTFTCISLFTYKLFYICTYNLYIMKYFQIYMMQAGLVFFSYIIQDKKQYSRGFATFFPPCQDPFSPLTQTHRDQNQDLNPHILSLKASVKDYTRASFCCLKVSVKDIKKWLKKKNSHPQFHLPLRRSRRSLHITSERMTQVFFEEH